MVDECIIHFITSLFCQLLDFMTSLSRVPACCQIWVQNMYIHFQISLLTSAHMLTERESTYLSEHANVKLLFNCHNTDALTITLA